MPLNVIFNEQNAMFVVFINGYIKSGESFISWNEVRMVLCYICVYLSIKALKQLIILSTFNFIIQKMFNEILKAL